MTTTTVTRQEIAGVLKRAGFTASTEGRNGRIGYATRSFGYSVTDNGERVYTCKGCGGRDGHRPGCTTRSGAAKYWRSRIVKDGTVTVTVHGATSSRRGDGDQVAATAARVAATLVDAGYLVTPKDDILAGPAFVVAGRSDAGDR
jgi:hypothetical protein